MPVPFISAAPVGDVFTDYAVALWVFVGLFLILPLAVVIVMTVQRRRRRREAVRGFPVELTGRAQHPADPPEGQ